MNPAQHLLSADNTDADQAHSTAGNQVQIRALRTIPDVYQDDCLGSLIVESLQREGQSISNQSILIVAQKVVSKAEGRTIALASVEPSRQALQLSRKLNKDPRKIELVLQESSDIVRLREAPNGDSEGLLITRHRNGFICANAGIDESNIDGIESVLLLPEDADLSARRLRQTIQSLTGKTPGIVITDTFGRPWRQGLVNVAIGLAGVAAVVEDGCTTDAWGKPLFVTKPALADELAAASGLLMGKDAKTPVIIFDGVNWRDQSSSINDLIRTPKEDLFL
ncbi:MAG: coenzyme F420-0:L-glutamate ligase [Cellvibrionaceae bacterium]|nr:coenzyme F420-0:L-glutamate ligase [Cellvibrionaceae bacterium]|tara:strand:+ start:57414 stop:58253 length:840 start_codon:yes stop_codon:yes gene_type:complete